MNLLDRIVESALASNPDLSMLRSVLEKEVLHHDILSTLENAGFLDSLTFIGGTCLRACYGSERLSEDLDFTGGFTFDKTILKDLGLVLQAGLEAKYGLQVNVSEPVREEGNVDTWKVRVVTRPEQPNLPVQRIHIDICSIESRDLRPSMLRNYYGIDMGTSGLILQVESREEILVDKILALALRPNRIKNRDVWDIVWLHRQGILVNPALLKEKMQDRKTDAVVLKSKLDERLASLPGAFDEYRKEMVRFLPTNLRSQFDNPATYWEYVCGLLHDVCDKIPG